jgi:hypothetical protein
LTCAVVLHLFVVPASAAEVPSWLPRYDLDIRMDVAQHQVLVRERVTWTNYHQRPTRKLVFNAHAHFTIPEGDAGKLAKILEILRLTPTEVLDFDGPPLNVTSVTLVPAGETRAVSLSEPPGAPVTSREELPAAYQHKIATALEVALPREVRQGESITVDLTFTLRLPQKQGRWGQWKGITFLAQWLPVAAFYDEQGWQPTPFIPWHQPFYNEAGIYSARVTLPADQKIGSSGVVAGETELGNGWRRVEIQAGPIRDFALFCSAHFQEHVGQAGNVRVRCLALPEHEFYAREMLRIVSESLPTFEQWFGSFPYPQFTVVESYFGWNGNECGDLVMIDARIFGMPHMARSYVDLLLSHELCHQWWYNAVGTNGYAETWMDEGLANYFSHRLEDRKIGKNNVLLEYPRGLDWLPNIHREDYRFVTYLGVVGRGQDGPTVQDMPGFGHVINLNAMAYDRGGKIVGMIEQRLGEAAFLDFMRQIYSKYYFRVLRVADFRRELEAYTGHSWEEFFQDWLYGKGRVDWCLERVDVHDASGERPCFLACLRRRREPAPCRATVLIRQKGKCMEPTVLGFSLDGSDEYQIRIPIEPGVAVLELKEPPARVEALAEGRFRVEISLPCRPTQIAVDPDEALLDANPSNNTWKSQLRIRVTPLYFQLDETDLTNAYDRRNIIVGPWLYGATYPDPWYTRSTMFGLRAGLYRTQEYYGGAYLAYRTDDRNLVAGVDGLIDHFPWPQTQVGINVERSLATLSNEDIPASRAVLFARYIFNYCSSLYLPPINYVEGFAALQNRSLPNPNETVPGANLFDSQTTVGVHYHLDYLTPYWYPVGGIAVDTSFQQGVPIFGENAGFQELYGQVSTVHTMPDWLSWTRNVPGLHWVPDSLLAGRVYGAAALPNNAQILSLGGGDHFRGFNLSERQGSVVWLASLEWRVPLATDLTWDQFDHIAGIRNIYGAAFYDIGDAYLENRSLGPVAHAVGLGLHMDVAWFSLIERTVFRFEVAKAVGTNAPVQFWFGVRTAF